MKNKHIFLSLLIFSSFSCNHRDQSQDTDNKELTIQTENQVSIPLILPASLENRRAEFQGYVRAARENIQLFSIESY